MSTATSTPGSEVRVEDSRPLRECINPILAERVVISGNMEDSSIEQYRRLAAVLHHAQTQRHLKVLMITSALPGEGKTLTGANLALTLSESYRRRVLLIDADLRRPAVHDIFHIPITSGLSEGLKSVTARKLPIIQLSQCLSILPAGEPDPDPMGSLTSERMKRVIQEAAATFDWVIIDTPPIGLLPDAGLLAAMTDAALLVIGAGSTPYKLVRKSVDAIGPDRIIGVVLNRAERVARGSHYGYGYYGYGSKQVTGQ